jgi:hypothetical protein
LRHHLLFPSVVGVIAHAECPLSLVIFSHGRGQNENFEIIVNHKKNTFFRFPNADQRLEVDDAG